MLSDLFQESDYVFFMTHGLDKKPKFAAHTQLPYKYETLPAYYSINPIDIMQNRNDRGVGTQRAGINVTAFRNFLFESDTLPLDVQLQLLKHLHTYVPLAQVTFSGASSFHAIISVADTLPFKPHTSEGLQNYSQAWRALNAELTQHASEFLGLGCPGRVFDPSCKDPSRLSRTPNAIRPDNQVVQDELPNFGGYLSSDDVLALMRKHDFNGSGTARPRLEQVTDMDIELFKIRLLYPENRGLKAKLSMPETWANSENMYPTLFQLTLWIIDAVGAPLNTTLVYLSDNVFPAIYAAGYPRNPELAVYNAYSWKGLT